VLLYASDFDRSGEVIGQDFIERAGCFEHVERVALRAEQVEQYDLPPLPGKVTDSRWAGLVRRHGRLLQVELHALPPDELRRLYEQPLAVLWDMSAFDAVLEAEHRDRQELGT
jgi:hypothetical protein